MPSSRQKQHQPQQVIGKAKEGLMFDIQHFYNNPPFSDITIRFSQRDVKCHKMVLCTGSEYFNALCGPESRFRESDQTVVELLDDDDPDAVEAVLKHIYTFSYAPQFWNRTDPEFHLNVCITARKYLVPTLEKAAVEGLKAAGQILKDGSVILSLLQRHSEVRGDIEALDKVVADIREKNLGVLIGKRDFRALLDNDDALLQLVVNKIELATGLREKRQLKCRECGSQYELSRVVSCYCGIVLKSNSGVILQHSAEETVCWTKRN